MPSTKEKIISFILSKFGITLNLILFVSLIVRVLIIFITNWWFERNGWRSLVYTDIDYKIFLQAAMKVMEGESPYLRPTYRYTPLLSYLMIPSVSVYWNLGKIIFSLADVAIGWILVKKLDCSLLNVSIWWLFNPFVIVIGTRGSSDSIVCLLVLLFIYLFQSNSIFFSGILYGLAVHFKLYPIIYSVVIMKLFFNRKSLKQFVIFSIGAAITFTSLLGLFYYLYGYQFIYESFIFHLVRKDHRHNFSPFFYPLYYWLQRETTSESLLSGVSVLIPSIGSWLLYGLSGNEDNWIFVIFQQTCLFVIFNKVITSQYYLWIFVFFPFFIDPTLVSLLCYLAFLIIHFVWNWCSNMLENKGENYYLQVWIVSVINFCYCLALFLSLSAVKKEKIKTN